ncbi:hypothetical protein LTR08_006439 [Meristemomyces frigidus]|nr:hypothetical protein LTR08_006439 [Meristemomyces frigidus]
MPDLQSAAIQLAETFQTAHINHSPDPKRDFAPSTAADTKQRVEFDPSADDSSDIDGVDEDEIPISLLRPTPRGPQMPPLPDLRFEQSYLASIKDAKGWQGVAYITVRDQLFMPLLQGMVWSLMVAGWHFFNRGTQFSGQTVGAKIRRWWWGVNNWKLPENWQGTLRDRRTAEKV